MRIGVEIDGTSMRLGIVDGGRIYMKTVAPTKADQPRDVIIDHLKELLNKIMNTNIRGIGVGVSGIVDKERGISKNAVNIPSWRDVPIKDILEKEFRIPVFVNNDTNCFAFAERYYGEGTIYRNIACLTLSIGVGAGIIINSELYDGNNMGAGEFGILPYLDSDYEHYCGQKFFRKYDTTAEEAYALAMQGDEKMIALWRAVGMHIGNLINVILLTYDPQVIILGGDLLCGYEFFRESMEDSMKRFPFAETIQRVKILISTKEDMTLIGAASLVV